MLGLEVVPLRYRMASEILPALLPLVQGRGAVMGAEPSMTVALS